MPENSIPSRRLTIVGAAVPNQDHDSGRASALPAHTYGHLDCPGCEALRTVSLSRISPAQTVGEAADLWLASRSVTPAMSVSRARFIRESTEKSYRQYAHSLALFFQQTPLDKIHLGNLRAYQEARIAGAAPFVRKRRPNKNEPVQACPAAPKKVNQELSMLKMIMRRAGVWSQELDEFYEPYSEDVNDVQRAFSPQEQRRWLEVAKTQERWWLVWWYSVLAFETSMSTNEIRSLRLGDVNLLYPPARAAAAELVTTVRHRYHDFGGASRRTAL